MIHLAISVEGKTEEDFVKFVLAPHLRGKGVRPFPILPHGRRGNILVDSWHRVLVPKHRESTQKPRSRLHRRRLCEPLPVHPVPERNPAVTLSS